MKLSFQSLILSCLALYPTAVAAELVGVPLPSSVSSAGAFGFFAAALTVALLIAEYSRRQVILPLPRRMRKARPLLQPAREVFEIIPGRRSQRASTALGV